MIKRGNVLSRILHKWIGLVIGLQVLIWLTSGLYMVVVDLDFIHGDPLVQNMQRPIVIPDSSRVSIAALKKRYPNASHIGLRPVMDKTYYTVTTADSRYLVDPATTEVISPLAKETASQIAVFHFNGDAAVINASLITADPPMEIKTRRLPLWRVDFNDRYSTSFYIDPYSGRLVTRRHQYWRIFDFLWMLHIMDYDERSDAHNPLLVLTQVAGLAFCITGLWLLFYSFSGRRKRKLAEG